MYILTDNFFDDNGEELISSILGYADKEEALEKYLNKIIEKNAEAYEKYKTKYKEYLDEMEKFIIDNYDEIVYSGFKNKIAVFGKNKNKENNELDYNLINFLKRNTGFINTNKEKPKFDFTGIEKLNYENFKIHKINEIK